MRQRFRATDEPGAAVAAAEPFRLPFADDLYAVGASRRPLRPLRDLLREGILQAEAAPAPDTFRVAIFRVDFLRDSAGETSTGNGRFDLRREVSGIPVDPPPHDRRYFEAHARALSRFYRAQSYESLVLVCTVFPEEPDSAYHLTDTADYGPWRVAQGEDVLANAEKFVGDAIHAADASGDIDFSRFDGFVVAHAGADFQGDINRDSPSDIPTFTLSLRESLQVTGGKVGRVLVLPETVTQDGRWGALNGVFAHEFGHVLGLPDLYNIYTGVPQVGYWSLMDSGENITAIVVDPAIADSTTESGFAEFAVSGAFPASFDPWCRLQAFPKGVAPRWVEEQWEGNLEAVEVNPRIPYVSLDGLEYFLVENRALDLDGNGFPFVEQDSTTGVFLGPVDDPDNPGQGGDREYDAVLPGGGVLIWHIDDKIILPAMADQGEVNLGVGYRGIAIEEADGIWDQGRFNLGRPEDAFYPGNNALFAPGTIPGSEANDGSWTGIRVEVTSAPSRFMGISIRRPLAHAGWPFFLPQTEAVRLSAVDLTLADVDGNGRPQPVFLVEGEEEGKPLGIHGIGRIVDREGSGPAFALFGRAFHQLLPDLVSSDRFVAVEGDEPQPVMAAVEDGGQVRLWDRDGDDLMDPDAAVTALTPPVLVHRRSGEADVVLCGGRGEVFAVTASGDVPFVVQPAPAAGRNPETPPVFVPAAQAGWIPSGMFDSGTALGVGAEAFAGGLVELFPVLDSDDGSVSSRWARGVRFEGGVLYLRAGFLYGDPAPQPGVVVVTEDSMAVVRLDGEPGDRWALPPETDGVLPPALGDLDGDGLAEIAVASDGGGVSVWNGDGSLAVGWPRTVSAPVRDVKILDLNGDGELDLAALDGSGRLHGWSGRGEQLPEFPRAIGPYRVRSSWIADLDGDGRLTWVAAAEGGALAAVRVPGAVAVGGDWRTPAGSPEGGGYLPAPGAGEVDVTRPDLGGKRLLVYPNPVRNEGAEIRFLLTEGETAHLQVLDVTGRDVSKGRLGYRGDLHPGENAVHWDVAGMPPGLYFCRLERQGAQGTTVVFSKIVVMQ